MTYCALRGASVMYTEYLANMGVAASLTMPILIEGKLWAMIACHHMTPTHFAHPLRAACELLSQVVSLQLKATERVEQLARRVKVDAVQHKLMLKAAQEGDLLALSDQEPSLLDAMDAHGAALYHRDRWWCAGNTPRWSSSMRWLTGSTPGPISTPANTQPTSPTIWRAIIPTDRRLPMSQAA
jgi:light-regulated signal transduction histidine kinase (bacteriophytochrome)